MRFIRSIKAFIAAAAFGAIFLLAPQNLTAQTMVSQNSSALQQERYKNRDFYIVDLSEMTIDGASALVLTFSAPLADIQKLNEFILVYNDTKKKDVDGSWELSKNKMEVYFKYLEPETKYTVSISKQSSLKIKNIAQKSLNLKNDYKSYVTTQSLKPMVGFSSSSSLLPLDFADGLPVMTLNVNSVDIDFFRIDLQALPQAMDYIFGKSSSYAYYIEEVIKKGAKMVYSGRFNLNAKKNVRENVIIPIKNIKELQNGGIYLAVMKQSGKYDTYYIPTTIFSVTNIGVVAHKTKDGYEIFTQSLLNGGILPNINVKIIDNGGKILAEKQTNEKGYAKIPTSNIKEKPRALIAQSGNKVSFTPLNVGALDLSEFKISGTQSHNKTLFTFGPRDLYRTGEKVFVNALLRDADGKKISEQPIKVDIIQADNKIARTFTWQGKDGFYQYAYELPENAPTGSWRFKFDLGDNNERFYVFKVEDFMPEKMALEINASGGVLSKDDSVAFSVYGKYLYGAAASGNKLTGNIYSVELREAVKSLPGFYFGSVRENELDRHLGGVDTELDDNGKATISVDNTWSDVKSPINILLEASLMESGGRPITRTALQPIWPAPQMPAIRPTFGKKQIYN
jgi:uncharacterized protein YfaS (alpha-2-macroglobulin family)